MTMISRLIGVIALGATISFLIAMALCAWLGYYTLISFARAFL